jgi:hypothetical protein
MQSPSQRIAEHVSVIARPTNEGYGQLSFFDQQQQCISKTIRVVRQCSTVIDGIRPESQPGDLDAMLMHFPKVVNPGDSEAHHQADESPREKQDSLRRSRSHRPDRTTAR